MKWLRAFAASVLLVSPTNAQPPLRATVMLEGHFVAGSRIPDKEALGGALGSTNYPVELDRAVADDSVSLVALPDESTAFSASVAGFRVILANTTSETLVLTAADSRLSIVREALDADGTWKPVERLPWSFCGNSYHRVFLPPGQYWSFVAPVYDGTMTTEMRFVLHRGDEAPIYSNQFPGRVNPEQFIPPADPYTDIHTGPARKI